MIKVLGKTFNILSLLSSEKNLPLRDIARYCNLNKTTAGNIVTTLKKLGWLAQNDKGEYLLSEAFFGLSYPYICKVKIEEIVSEQVRQAAIHTGERVVCAELRNGERYIMAQADSEHAVTINKRAVDEKNTYSSATGRILFSHLSVNEREKFFESLGKPSKAEWPAFVNDESGIFEKICKRGYEIIKRRDFLGIAVPVYDNSGKVFASIGVYLPKFRFDTKRQKIILNKLNGASENITAKVPWQAH